MPYSPPWIQRTIPGKVSVMAKKITPQSMTAEHVRAVQELRRSNAARPHGKKTPRGTAVRRAINDSKEY